MSSLTQTLTQTPRITRSICLLNTINQPQVQEFKALCHFRQKDPRFKIQLLYGSDYGPKQKALKINQNTFLHSSEKKKWILYILVLSSGSRLRQTLPLCPNIFFKIKKKFHLILCLILKLYLKLGSASRL